MADWSDVSLKPTHLGIFLLDRHTGVPVSRLPVYAEVVWTDREEPPPSDGRFEDAIARGLSLIDEACDGSVACRAKVIDAMAAVLPLVWPQAVRDRLAQNTQEAIDVFAEVIQETRVSARAGSLSEIRDEELRARLEQAIRAVSERRGLVVLPPRELSTWRMTYPLGVLASDHVGYVSFDLARLPVPVRRSVVNAMKALRDDPEALAEAAIWVYPLSAGLARFEALTQRRYAHDAVVARLQVGSPAMPALLRNLGLPALQKPSLTDWRLSPASFAATPAALIGEDGCETLWPANLALQEFHFYQVVRLTDVGPLQPALPFGAALGIVHDYRLAWYPLGHSLGQILYSLPLAPAESVNLAVIDWTRRDDTARTEDSKLNEQIVHDQRRDRTITETVNAAIKEYQEGSNFTAGVAQSAGLSGTIGKFGVATGLAGALGGATSDSSGTRDLAATTVQQLSEHISQASSAMREFQSTVVVRSVQSEHEAIETRTIVNYNHSHAMTILYYEVLRHFRVTTELVRYRPAVLVKLKTDWFLPPNIEPTMLKYRSALEAALLDDHYKGGFDAYFRTVHRANAAGAVPSGSPVDPGNRQFKYFTLAIKTGGFSVRGGTGSTFMAHFVAPE